MKKRYVTPPTDAWGSWTYKVATGSLQPGIYLFKIRVKGREANQKVVGAFRALFTTQLELAGYTSISVSNFLPVPDAATEVGTWPVIVSFTVPEQLGPKKKGLDPKGLLKVAVNIVVATVGAVIVGTDLILTQTLEVAERVVDKPFDLIKDTTSKVFNPATLLLVVFALFLVFLALPNLKR